MSETTDKEREILNIYHPATSILEEAEQDFKRAWETVWKMKYKIENSSECEIAKTYIAYNLGDVTFMEKISGFLEYKLPSYGRVIHAISEGREDPTIFDQMIKLIEENVISGLETAIEMGTPMKAFYTLNLKDFKRGLEKLKEIRGKNTIK